MRWRVVLIFSLVLNLILASGWIWSKRQASSKVAELTARPATTNTLTKTAVVVRRTFFSWQEIESQDYTAYIKNLREIGCPEQTIRDIIIADVTQMLRSQMREQSGELKPNPKWWTNRRDPAELQVSEQKQDDLWQSRRNILNQLLGPGWEMRTQDSISGTNSYQQMLIATMDISPALQSLPTEKKQFIARLLSGQNDPWKELAGLLSPAQLEDAQLRFSAQADALRDELDSLPGFETKPEEFKSIFKATADIDARISALADRDDASANESRAKLLAERDAAIRLVLTPQRYEQFARLRDPAYLSAVELLARGDGNATALPTLYAINRESSAELERIQNDENLTETQREIELKKLELEQMKATALALGEPLLEEQPVQSAPKSGPKKTHSVAGGESLERIARIYGVDQNALRAANPNLNFNNLKAGDKVSVPLNLIYPLPPPN
jgi:LysM repeat protein